MACGETQAFVKSNGSRALFIRCQLEQMGDTAFSSIYRPFKKSSPQTLIPLIRSYPHPLYLCPPTSLVSQIREKAQLETTQDFCPLNQEHQLLIGILINGFKGLVVNLGKRVSIGFSLAPKRIISQ